MQNFIKDIKTKLNIKDGDFTGIEDTTVENNKQLRKGMR